MTSLTTRCKGYRIDTQSDGLDRDRTELVILPPDTSTSQVQVSVSLILLAGTTGPVNVQSQTSSHKILLSRTDRLDLR